MSFYGGGFVLPFDPNEEFLYNHIVTVVGYTEKYWLIRQAYGEDYGENGYIRLEFNKNVKGICTLGF